MRLLQSFLLSFCLTCIKAQGSHWIALNGTVEGRLHAVSPLSLPCFSQYNGQSTAPDGELCGEIQANYTSGLFRTEYYGAFAHSQDEICASNVTAQCLLDSSRPDDPLAFSRVSCNQGSISSYYVEVQKASDVQAAIRFSQQTGVKLSIKNSGHDYLTRSSRKGSLGLWTRKLQSLSYDPFFNPTNCVNETFEAITVGAGVNFDQVYTFAHENGVTYLGGSSPSVGASGGWLQGGGHSVLSPVYGLGVDRVVQFKVVTPDGELRIANSCTNVELFWGLRGGGGGTFGVVLESTSRVEREMPLSVVSISFPATAANQLPFLSILLNHTEAWANEGWGGFESSSSLFRVTPLLNISAANASMTVPATYAVSQNGTFALESLPNWFEFYTKYVKPAGDVGVGTANFQVTRLIPSSLFSDEGGRTAILNYLSHLLSLGIPPSILAVTPTLYKYTPGETSAPGAWRTSLWHLGALTSWTWNSTVEEREQTVSLLNDLTARSVALAPDSATYLNEASPWTVDWQKDFWAENYERLLNLKKRIDPSGLLSCWRCVGWDVIQEAAGQGYECMSGLAT